ncbi:hypothetical protein [Sandaracinus amylolyticus]|uniref:Outer membrane protein beta-barrel domain-containing protein n=1 Tax=Sandaracinus amylolyticus TaxID=927083 RepID=A0A0F6YHE3_9BACT|nr:hypothetical protein [Sandaracinus amylolyticus]AKF03941.1 hypothetical protein DB32_001090 [Sandaracinus amylolyticus]
MDALARRPIRADRAARTGTLLASVVLLLLPPASSAAAQAAHESRVGLRWIAPPECPDAPTVRAQVAELAPERRLTYAVLGHVEVTAGGEYRLSLRAEGAPGLDRTFVSRDCATLASTAALVLATIAAPDAPSVERVDTRDEAQLPSSPSARSPLRTIVGLTVGAGAGYLPRVSPAMTLSIGMGIEGLELELFSRASTSTSDPSRPQLWFVVAGVRVGWAFAIDWFEIRPYVSGDGGFFSVAPELRADPDREVAAPVGIASVGLGTELRAWAVRELAFVLVVDGSVPLVRRTLALPEHDVEHAVAEWGTYFAALGVALRIP